MDLNLSLTTIPKQIQDEVVNHIQARNERTNKQKIKVCLSCVLANLIKYKRMKYSRGVDMFYPSITRYNRNNIKRKAIISVVDSLELLGWCHTTSGVRTKHFSMCFPARKLLDLFSSPVVKQKIQNKHQETVIMRNKDKRMIDYRETAFTRMSRVVIRAYNSILDNTNITLDGEPLHPQYKRIFSGGWDRCGRLFDGCIQQIPSARRLELRINDSEVVEVDYHYLHPALLIGVSGGVVEELYPNGYDPYGFLPSEHRGLAKKVINILLNTSSQTQAASAIRNELHKSTTDVQGYTAKQLLELATAHNEAIVHHFYEESGLWCMFLESTMACDIISVFVDKGLPILCIHDSFIVQREHEQLLLKAMKDAYVDICGNPSVRCYVLIETTHKKEDAWL